MQQLNRSHSLFGTLKSIVSSSIPWFGSSDGISDVQGKRKAAPVERDEPEEEVEHRNKRKRVHSPEAEVQQRDGGIQARSKPLVQPQSQGSCAGYLDPPLASFKCQPSQVNGGLRPNGGHARASSLAVLDRVSSSNGAYGRRTASPGRSGYATTNGISRTQSMDPPPRRRTAGVAPQPISRDASMEDFRDKSRSPSSRPFRMRTSMTPQPTGLVFGPNPSRRERDPSEPPPLAALIENPIFVKAPSQPPPDREEVVRPPSITLGNVAEVQRAARPLKRSRSSLMIDDSSNADLSNGEPVVPTNAAEIALRELEVYKTPLLPTRMQGSVIPDMFRTSQSKKGRTPVLMHDRDRKPRLGMSDTGKAREKEKREEGQESPSVKPYAGRGGMKKLLERRRMEEEEAHHKARQLKLSVIEEADEEGQYEEPHEDEPLPEQEPETDFQPTSIGGREQSSLRVGRKRNNRNHIQRPQMRSKAGGRYAAIFEEEDEDSMVMDEESERERKELEEAAKKVPAFNLPPNFSFAKEIVPPIQQDTNAKEPPIAALPFSFSKVSTPSTSSSSSSAMSVDKPSAASAPLSAFSFAPPTASPTLNASRPTDSKPVSAPAPTSSLFARAPEATTLPLTKSEQPTESQHNESVSPKSSSAIPNFFASSAIFSKPSATVGTQTSFSLLPQASASDDEKGKGNEAPKPVTTTTGASSSMLGFGNAKASESEKKEDASPGAPPLFGAAESTGPAASSIFGSGLKSAFPASTTSKPVATSLFGSAPSAAAPAATTEAAPAAPGPSKAPFTFGAPATPAKQLSPQTQSPFLFAAPTKPTEPAAPTPALAPAFSFAAPVKEEAPKTEEKPANETAPPLSIFGAASKSAAPTTFTFAAPAPAANGTATAEPAKSPFTFAAPAAQPAPPQSTAAAAAASAATPVVEAPKPLFGGTSAFSFNQPPANNPSAATEPPKSPFTFTPPTSATAEKKPFAFNAPSAPAGGAGGSMLFGGTTGATATTNAAAKPFTFSAPPPPVVDDSRAVTPPRNGDSSGMMMDESPIRGNGMDVNGGKPEAPKTGAFTFAPSTNTAFGQTSTAGGSAPFAFGSANPAASPFGAKPAETKPAEKPFAGFGQTAPSTGFSFNQKAPETAAPAAGFSFANATTPTTAPAAPFAFNAPQISQSTSFGQPASAGASAPASPFGQTAPPAGFAFNATPTSATAPNNPFSFNGSQPASPAAANAGLPAQPASTGFPFGAPNATTAAGTPSPFGAAAPLPSAGTPSFTMGAAPPAPAGARLIKKMPTRRKR